jgi:hypothetical protein
MKDEDEVVISKCQWDDYLAYNLFSINFKGIVFDIKIEPKNIVKLEKLIELKKKQGAIEVYNWLLSLKVPKPLIARTLNNEEIIFVYVKDIKKRLKELKEGVESD